MEFLLRLSDGKLDWPVYPGHPITIAVQIAKVFPSLQTAQQPNRENIPAALCSSDVNGAGGNVYLALEVLERIAKGETLEAVLAWSDTCSEQTYATEWPEACEQARRYLATIDLVAWSRTTPV